MNQRLTIKHIAKALNVSVSTVSKALNDSYEISEKTKLRVQTYAKEHHYKPNILAQNLQNKHSKTIGVIIPNILNYFFAKVLSGVEKIATQRGYNIITCLTNESYEKEVHTLETLSNGSIDGFIACLSEGTLKKQKIDHITEVINQGTPVVLYDRVHKDIICDKVVIDNIKTAYKATRYLMKSGCKNIAFISTQEGLNVGKFRAKGYLKALSKYNVEPNDNLIIRLNDKTDLKERIETMLKNHKVDGIFTVDEPSAAIAVQVLNSLDLKVPNDVSIIGFTNGILSEYSVIPLTTVNMFGKKIGKHATRRLIDKIENKVEATDYKTEIIRAELIQRNSTKKLLTKF